MQSVRERDGFFNDDGQAPGLAKRAERCQCGDVATVWDHAEGVGRWVQHRLHRAQQFGEVGDWHV